jgi:isoleucyl-tRNA synthetase
MSISFPQVEGEIVRAWKENNAFETQVKLSEGKPPFNFYDGPPFGTHPSHSIFKIY